ncbi:hypothetical protein Y1Q_0021453 [Alligator mississippiensis]|uniref:Uncharacterized protein n=1 Tax=Alligator mississippiensis TaxID=8496 RepID=A0A151P9V3_ALLMI|nr:hypothetical protein Y1Q_0021453 [Alligator mississippiensis]
MTGAQWQQAQTSQGALGKAEVPCVHGSNPRLAAVPLHAGCIWDPWSHTIFGMAHPPAVVLLPPCFRPLVVFHQLCASLCSCPPGIEKQEDSAGYVW